MKWTFASTGMIIIGLIGIIIIVLFHEITVSNEQDYYTLKEATEASMLEAIDSAYYRLTGKLKMSEEKFVENFTKRFINSSTYGQGNYYIDFYQITEYPAKVSLRIVDDTNSYEIFTSFDESIGSTKVKIVNELSAIIDGYEIDDTYNIIEGTYEDDISLGQSTIGLPTGSVRPICPKYNTMNNDPTYKVYGLLWDYKNKKCSFQSFLVLPGVEDEVDLKETPWAYAFVTDNIICPEGYSHYNSEGYCTQ